MRSQQFIELAKCAEGPWHFLTRFCKTQDPARGVLPFPDYPYLKNVLDVAECERFVLIPKSRQMMVTWTMCAYFLWRALFRGPGIYLFLSRNERCAEELIDRVRFMFEQLPVWMQPSRTANSRHELAFGKLAARILSLPATPDGPRMYSPSGVFWDEMAFTPYDEQIWSALQPALQSGGKFIGVSSSGGAMNFFARMAKGEKSKSKIPNSGLRRTPSRPSQRSGEGAERGVQNDKKGTSQSQQSVQNEKDESSFHPASPIPHPLFHIHRIHYSDHPERKNWREIAGAGLSEAQWQREQEISFDSADDLVYSEFDPATHILSSEHRVNSEWDIYRSIDFGYRHPFVLWIQKLPNGEYVVFDEWAGHNATTEQMYDVLCKTNLIHGIIEKDILWTACDPAGAAAQDSGLSPVDFLTKHGIRLCYRSSRILPGIEQIKAALRDVTGNVSLRISPRCKNLIADIARYRWAVGREEPLKDGQCDHSMDALRYFFVNLSAREEMNYAPRISGMKNSQ